MVAEQIINIFFLAIGIICGVFFLFSIQKEPRRMANGIVLSLFFYFTVSSVVHLYYPNRFTQEGMTLGLGSEIMTLLLLILCLGSMVTGVALWINGIRLLQKERMAVAHLLPSFFGTLAILWPIVLFIIVLHLSDGLVWIFWILFNIFMYLPFMFFSFLSYSICYALLPKNKNCDFILALGAGLGGQERVTPLLASRLDKAIDVFKAGGQRAQIIVSGGQGADEVVSEASAMQQYLLEKGISKAQIIMEDQSRNTYENMVFSKKIMEDLLQKYTCVFVTSNYHVLRGAILARSVGLNAQGVGGKTAIYYLPTAFLREYIAIVFAYKGVMMGYIFIVLVWQVIRWILILSSK